MKRYKKVKIIKKNQYKNLKIKKVSTVLNHRSQKADIKKQRATSSKLFNKVGNKFRSYRKVQ